MYLIVEGICYNSTEVGRVYQRITQLRLESGKTIFEVAHYLKCPISIYRKYEAGTEQIPLYCMFLLAQLYSTSIDYLVGLTEEKIPYAR